MSEAADQVIDLIYGYWRSQILYAGVELGVFDHIARNRSMQAKAVAEEIGADEKLLYRLMRALASLGLLVEDESRGFAISEAGELLRSGYPGSLRDRVLVADGPEHYAIWKHLPSIIRDGKQDGFVREFGARAFEYARTNAHYRRTFDRGMTSHSVLQSSLVLQALRHYDFLRIGTMCDIGGGHGHLICTLLKAYPHLSGLVLDLPEVFQDPSQLWASRFGLEDRCRYVAGDMFNRVPQADAYCLKMILHDWDDQECIKILSNLRIATSPEARVFVMEQVVPGPHEPHISKLFDIHMMCWGTGRERPKLNTLGFLRLQGGTITGPGIRKIRRSVSSKGACQRSGLDRRSYWKQPSRHELPRGVIARGRSQNSSLLLAKYREIDRLCAKLRLAGPWYSRLIEHLPIEFPKLSNSEFPTADQGTKIPHQGSKKL